MKIYLQEKNINLEILNNNIKNYSNYYKLIYSIDGIYKIYNDKIYKLSIIDKPISQFSINGKSLLIDNSIINYEKNITTVPFNHKLFEINEIKYKIANEISIVLLYNKNNLFDNYFETNNTNTNINNIKNILSEYI